MQYTVLSDSRRGSASTKGRALVLPPTFQRSVMFSTPIMVSRGGHSPFLLLFFSDLGHRKSFSRCSENSSYQCKADSTSYKQPSISWLQTIPTILKLNATLVTSCIIRGGANKLCPQSNHAEYKEFWKIELFDKASMRNIKLIEWKIIFIKNWFRTRQWLLLLTQPARYAGHSIKTVI